MTMFVLVPIKQGSRQFEIVCELDWDDDGPFAQLPRDRDTSLPATVRLYQNKLLRLDAPGTDEGLPPKYHYNETIVVYERH